MVAKGISRLPFFRRWGLGLHDPQPALLQNLAWVLLGIILIVSTAVIVYGTLFQMVGAVVR